MSTKKGLIGILTGGTFLHTSRTNPSAVKKEEVPEALRATFNQDKNDLTF